ncbi:MAG: acetylxylan esterase [Lentisphaeria bacterium]|nr:acetylxylan esterase [Lentisphaeria bacterium]
MRHYMRIGLWSVLLSGALAGCTVTGPDKPAENQPAAEAKPAAGAKPALESMTADVKSALKTSAAEVKSAVAAVEADVKSALKPPVDLLKVRILGETNKSALSYQEGEEMIFTFKADFGEVSPEGYSLVYTRRGDDGVDFSGKAKASEPLVVKTSLGKPGFVSVTVHLMDEKGKIPTVKIDARRRRQVAFYAGAAVKPEQLKDCGEPADFDAFWKKQRARLDAVPFAGKVTEKLVHRDSNVKVYAVSIPCVGRPATGYLTVPVEAQAKSLPAEVVYFGYGSSRQPMPVSGPKDRIVLRVNAHGQELGRDDAYYKEFFQSIRSNGYNYAFDPEQNKDPETAFFNGMALRALRALDYLKSRPEWDGQNLRAVGGSQGGLQTMWAAALDQDVTMAAPAITWCCDMAGSEKAGRIHGSWRIKYLPALDYYDPVFMAKRIKKAQVDITRAGLGDYTCPPSGLAISYNNLATPRKSIRWVQGSDHGFVPKESEVVLWKTY